MFPIAPSKKRPHTQKISAFLGRHALTGAVWCSWVQRMLDRNPAGRPTMTAVIDGWRQAMGMKSRSSHHH